MTAEDADRSSESTAAKPGPLHSWPDLDSAPTYLSPDADRASTLEDRGAERETDAAPAPVVLEPAGTGNPLGTTMEAPGEPVPAAGGAALDEHGTLDGSGGAPEQGGPGELPELARHAAHDGAVGPDGAEQRSGDVVSAEGAAPAEDTEDEIRDPRTGEPDRYVQPTRPRAGRHAAESRPQPLSAGGDFPLWPEASRTAARHQRRTAQSRRRAERSAARRRDREARSPGRGLALLVLLALTAAFFGWVGAEPFWLAVGHADRGVLTVTDCTGSGIAKRCHGDFTASGGRYTVRGVSLTGSPDSGRAGARLAARMVGAHGRQAYAGDRTGLLLRWLLPAALVLLLGLLIAVATGAWRLSGRQRLAVVGLSVAGPVVLSGGLLAAAW